MLFFRDGSGFAASLERQFLVTALYLGHLIRNLPRSVHVFTVADSQEMLGFYLSGENCVASFSPRDLYTSSIT